jgi:CheY-like chemotaxis protein
MTAGSWKGRRILLVEDNEVNRRLVRAMCEDLGLVVDVAADGEEAVTMVGAHDYAVVLMDCLMPTVDGLAATRAIRLRERTDGRRQAIVALTALAEGAEREQCLEAGMDGFLAKPCRRADLERVLSELLAPGGVATAPQSRSPDVGPRRLQHQALGEIRAFPGGERILQDAAHLLAQSLPASLDRLEHLVRGGDRDGTTQLAHQLKSSVGILGLGVAANLLRDLELRAPALPEATALDLVDGIRGEAAAAMPLLLEAVTTGGSDG